MARKPCCSKEGLKRGVWTSQEDKLLSDYIAAHGIGRWRTLPANAGLNRCGKSCRLRWLNYLRPDIKRGNITEEEEELILRLHRLLGNRWSLIAGRLPGRTDNEIKNYWNTYLRRKVSASVSVCNSKQSKKTKNAPSPEKPNPDESLGAVSVIRTKATRCTRSLLFGETSSADDDTPPPPDTSIDEQHWMRELVGNIVPDRPISKDSSYATTTTASCCGAVRATDVSFGEEDRCMGDWYLNCGILKEAEGEEGMGMCSFLDPDTYNWDSLTLGHKFQTS